MRIPVRCVCAFGLSLAALAIACGGGGSGNPNSPGGGGGTGSGGGGGSSSSMSFRVDGTATTPTSVTGSFANGILSIGGTDSARATTFSFAVTPAGAGPGTYTLGPLSAANALIMIGNPAAGWQAGVGIGSGTITINTLSSTNASGTFSFSLAAVPGTGATGTKTISEGTFNVTLTSTPQPPGTPGNGSTISVLIDGVQWTSSLSRRATLTNNVLGITGQDTNFRVITLAVPFSAGTMIPPSSPASITLDFAAPFRGLATMVLGAQNWDTGHDGGGGSVTVTSISQTRVAGTFTATLVNNPINVNPVPTVRFTNGTFDMALERF